MWHRSNRSCLTINDISEKACADLVEFEEEDSTTWDFRPDECPQNHRTTPVRIPWDDSEPKDLGEKEDPRDFEHHEENEDPDLTSGGFKKIYENDHKYK
jgi:hypothetical protein